MDPAERAARMRRLEVNQGQRALDGAWVVVRVDGRGFSKFTERRFQKPFDAEFHAMMCQVAEALVEDLQGVFAYVQSDEISLVLPRGWALFDRRMEKIVSLAAGRASAVFTLGVGELAVFDARAWVGATDAQLAEYFVWRQGDATRCALSTATYWTLRGDGYTAREATRELEGVGRAHKNEVMFTRGVNFNDLPAWQRRGVCVGWETYLKQGEDPRTGEKVEVERRRIAVDPEIPIGEAFGAYAVERTG